MKKIYCAILATLPALFFIAVAVSAPAITNSQIQKALKNPSLMNSPAAKKLMKEHGSNPDKIVKEIENAKEKQELESAEKENKTDTQAETEKQEQAETGEGDQLKEEIGKKDFKNGLGGHPLIYEPTGRLLKKLYDIQIRKKKASLKRFGMNFFSGSTKVDPSVLPVPDNYKINIKDTIGIYLYGANNDKFVLDVSKYGKILIPSLGPIHVAGVTFKDAKKLITNSILKAYLKTGVVVTIESFSTIQLIVSGEVKKPGVYAVSSFSTIKDAIIAAGGVSHLGTLRNIAVKRNDKTVHEIDLYELIINGKTGVEVLLKAGDVVFVPMGKKFVTLSGEVNKQGYYELKQKEDLSDLLKIAGGFRPSASRFGIQIKRYDTKNERIHILNVDIKDHQNISISDGDSVYVYNFDTSNISSISLNGSILRPGSRQIFKKDMTLGDFFKKEINKYGYEGTFLSNVYLDYVIIKRVNSHMKPLLLRTNLKKILNNDKSFDIKLQNRDEIYIFNKSFLFEDPYVEVYGDPVKRSGKYKFIEGMTLDDLYNLAGIFSSRVINRKSVSLFSIDVKSMEPVVKIIDMDKNPDYKLLEYDQITFYDYYLTNPISKVFIKGQVNKPGEYVAGKKLTMEKIIAISGGFTRMADKTKIEIVRYSLLNGMRNRKLITLSLKDSANYDFCIKGDDEITVFTIPYWYEKKKVKISGQVLYPGEYFIKEGESIYSVLKRAGGFTDAAFVNGIVFTREDVRKKQQQQLNNSLRKIRQGLILKSMSASEVGESKDDKKNMMNYIGELERTAGQYQAIGRISLLIPDDVEKLKKSSYNIVLKNGDTMFVPTEDDTVSIIGEVLNQTSVVCDKSYSFEDYLNMAGGLTELANKKKIMIVREDGRALTGMQVRSGWFKKGKKILRGDTIVVMPKILTTSNITIAKDISSILYQFAVTAASLKTLGVF